MATSGGNLTPDEQRERQRVRQLDAEALGWRNLLSLKRQTAKVDEDSLNIAIQIGKLSQKEQQNARDYGFVANQIASLEKRVAEERKKGTRASADAAKNLERHLKARKLQEKDLLQTSGGYLRSQTRAADKQKQALIAERKLIQDINKERGLGNRILDAFRTKEAKQRSIEAARLRVGGGANVAASAGGGGKGGGGDVTKLTGAASIFSGEGLGAVLSASVEALKNTLKGLGNEIKTQLTKPFSEAAALVGGGVGIGGGAVSGAGATSILGGLAGIAGKLPFIGGLMEGLINGFKTVLDIALGLDSANTRVAKSLGMSKEEAMGLRKSFVDIANTSNSLVVNQTRLLESQIELGAQLGVNNVLSGDILATNIELKEVTGLEVEARKSLAQSAIITNRNQKEIVKGVLGEVAAFKGLTGIAFNFQEILGEASKQTGVLGLQFAKFPEKLTKTLVQVKALGFSLSQVNDIAGGLIDFESSISKEFEAQVLLGRDINLTKAREAALNNDLATVSAEITKNVGSAGQFLKLNRIQQDAIAQSVGMTRDSLADTLKQQEAFTKLGAKDLKQANEKIQALQAQGKSQAEISKMLGEDAYNYITQTSTAEKLSEVMNKIKQVFVQFVERSGLIEFLTNPQKLENFTKGLVNRIAGAVDIIGELVGLVLDFASHLPGTDTVKWKGYAESVRGGGESIRSMGNSLNFGAAPSLSGTIESGKRGEATQSGTAAAAKAQQPIFNLKATTIVGTQNWGSQSRTSLSEDPGVWAQ